MITLSSINVGYTNYEKREIKMKKWKDNKTGYTIIGLLILWHVGGLTYIIVTSENSGYAYAAIIIGIILVVGFRASDWFWNKF